MPDIVPIWGKELYSIYRHNIGHCLVIPHIGTIAKRRVYAMIEYILLYT